jgi:aspartyl-tRNA(Asn)/glutamyl-tRNA(Gln) amidotransferase subunit A
MAAPLHELTIGEAGRLIENGVLSPVELTTAFLDRIEKLDPKLNAYITVTPDRAMEQATIAEAELAAGRRRGPLHGIPIALKDLFDTTGVATTSGSRVFANRVPGSDGTVAARLREAGAVLLGKLAMSENAAGGPDPSNGYPIPNNPWNLEHGAGGSSNGSAVAASAGLAMGTMGSCTRGSIRAPAAFCNVVGLKPTYGRVSRHGVMPLSWTLDHAGPITRTVEDAAIMLGAVAGYDPADPTSSGEAVPDYAKALGGGIEGLRIGVARHFFFDGGMPFVQPEPLELADRAIGELEKLGAKVEEISIPALEISDAAALVILLGEGYAFHQRNLAERPELYGDLNRAEFRVGGLFSMAEYVGAQRARNVLKAQYAEALTSVDVIASPTFAVVAPRHDAGPGTAVTKMPSYTGPYNLTGLPAISVPCGFTAAGLPLGLQLAGRPFQEATILRAAYAYEQATEHHLRRPLI